MTTIHRQLAGLNVQINGDSSLYMAQLDRELAIYPSTADEPDIIIHFGQLTADAVLAKNPTIHSEYKDGFAANFGQTIVRWRWDGVPTRVEWFSPYPGKNWRQKIRGLQYTHPYEQIGQVFFELVLIPTLQLFYHSQLLLLHGSALSDSEGRDAYFFGGTGGVGKTSLELLLAGNGYNFMADDICIVDVDGNVWGNFAWPKIYGYNTLGDEKMKRRLFQKRSLADRFFWELRMKFFGGSRVRRRVDPQVFFNNAISQRASLKAYYILFRDHSDTISITHLSAADAMKMSLNIMAAEYTILYRHLHWHQVNRTGQGMKPFISFDAIFDSWRMSGEKILADTRCYLVHVPMNCSATDLKANFPTDILRS